MIEIIDEQGARGSPAIKSTQTCFLIAEYLLSRSLKKVTSSRSSLPPQGVKERPIRSTVRRGGFQSLRNACRGTTGNSWGRRYKVQWIVRVNLGGLVRRSHPKGARKKAPFLVFLPSGVARWLSYQLSAISYQLSAISSNFRRWRNSTLSRLSDQLLPMCWQDRTSVENPKLTADS